MKKASHPSKAEVVANSDATTGSTATTVFAKSGYPKTMKENFKLFLNLFFNFFC
jgi:hypothetical protein